MFCPKVTHFSFHTKFFNQSYSRALILNITIAFQNCLDKNHCIFQKMLFNHTMIFFKLIDQHKLSDIYMNHNNPLGHMLIT